MSPWCETKAWSQVKAKQFWISFRKEKKRRGHADPPESHAVRDPRAFFYFLKGCPRTPGIWAKGQWRQNGCGLDHRACCDQYMFNLENLIGPLYQFSILKPGGLFFLFLPRTEGEWAGGSHSYKVTKALYCQGTEIKNIFGKTKGWIRNWWREVWGGNEKKKKGGGGGLLPGELW